MQTEWVGGDAVDWLDEGGIEDAESGRSRMSLEDRARIRAGREALYAEIAEVERTRGKDFSFDQLVDLQKRIDQAYINTKASIKRFEADPGERTTRGLFWYERAQRAAENLTLSRKKVQRVMSALHATERVHQEKLKQIAEKVEFSYQQQREISQRNREEIRQSLTRKKDDRAEDDETRKNDIRCLVLKLIGMRDLIPRETMDALFEEAARVIDSDVGIHRYARYFGKTAIDPEEIGEAPEK